MYITKEIYGTFNGYATIEEAEKDIDENINHGDSWVICEVVKAYKTDKPSYRTVDVKELQAKKLLEH